MKITVYIKMHISTKEDKNQRQVDPQPDAHRQKHSIDGVSHGGDHIELLLFKLLQDSFCEGESKGRELLLEPLGQPCHTLPRQGYDHHVGVFADDLWRGRKETLEGGTKIDKNTTKTFPTL